jgi:3-polyprenyl-4-hydroxybenzoate decarboxylase
MSRAISEQNLRQKTRVSRKAVSDPVVISNSNSNPVLPPVVVNGSYNRNSITVYGEVHSYIDNAFYESLKLENKLVLVEHATVLCEIELRHLISMLNNVKGSEWIWYKLKSRKKPVICIDNRIEVGLLSSIEERFLLSSQDPNDISTIMMYALKVLKKLESDTIKNMFNISRQVQTVYKESMQTIRKQIKTLYALLNDPDGTDFDEWLDVKNMLFNNIMKIASFMVDIHIINTIKANRENKEILIFVGAAHAYRLNKYFSDIFNSIIYNAPEEFIKHYKLDVMIVDN